ncbi:MAG TPA: type II toxin-antitoxin system HipA family toxin YjjJ [Gammaproteobacteria bacterium]
MATTNDLINVLRRNGVTGGGDLARLLGISPATLSRLVRAAASQVIRLGRTRGVRYGLLDEAPQIGSTLPVWMINERGEPQPFGNLSLLHGPGYWLEFHAQHPGKLYEGTPPFISDMAPQGYLGRTFPDRFPELDLPPRIIDWSDTHQLQAVARRGEDAPGNLVVGAESMDRFLARRTTVILPREYPEITRDLARQGTGSSAGGEYPKFTAFNGEQHVIVKFTSGDGSPADQRWRDLLASEAIAAETLRRAGHAAVTTRIHDIGEQRFLEIERFDRPGKIGRRGILSLAALDDDRYGKRDNWVAAADRLFNDTLINNADLEQIRFLETFGRLIGNTDRHFGNITFFWHMLPREELKLAPAYDMLPMMFAPATGGMIVERPFEMPPPTSSLLSAWPHALDCARAYWAAVQNDERISRSFREIAAHVGQKLKA